MTTTSAFRDRIQAAVGAAVGRPLTWAIVVGLIAAWPIAWALLTPLPPRLPILGTVPPFELTAQDGSRFGSKDLAGRVWLASFIFTRCETVCPAITRQMARIQGRTRNLEPTFHLVSISVDPEFDDPARLAAYARAHRASPRMWTFLTGPAGDLRDAVTRGLRVSMAKEAEHPGKEAISHGTNLVLVDGEGRIRGYYDPDDPSTVDRVVRDAALLVNRG
jgi:protein SCO1